MPSFKIMSTLLVFSLFSLAVHADFLRVEMGVGAFAGDPGGSFEAKSGGDVSLEDIGISQENDLYAWAYLKHPVPIIPNARIEYLSLTHAPDGGGNFDVNELDGILYYNLLDDTFFLTLDLGVDVKYVETTGADIGKTATLGLLYGRVRVEPTQWLGFEVLLKATNYGDNSGYDARVKADYTMTFIPLVHPALELGYRIHKIQYGIGDYINKAEYTGVYGGLMLRF